MKKIFALAILLLGAQSLSARDRQSFDKDWLFVLADSASMQNSEYADGHWRRPNLPHDWAIGAISLHRILREPAVVRCRAASDGIASTSLFRQTRSTTVSPSPSMACI